MRVQNFIYIVLFLINANALGTPTWHFDTRYSTLKITDNGTFTNNYPIANWDGTLIKASGGSITGEHISFIDGLLEDEGNQILLKGIFDPAGFIYLRGNDTFNAQPGYILQNVQVSGNNNRLLGQPIFSGPLTLADASTTLTIGIQSQMNKNIVLNNGTLVLANNLVFADNAIITGNGEVHGNTYDVATGGVPFAWSSNINWHTNIVLNTCVDFTGSFTFNAPQNKIQGNGYVYNLTGGGTLTVASGSTLTLASVVIKGLGDGAGFGKIILEDSTSTLVLTNVTLMFSDNYTTGEGTWEVKGPTTAILKGNDWLFNDNGVLEVDCLTLWKDNAGSETCGDILFESGANLELLNYGTIDYITLRCNSIIESLESCCEYNGSRIDSVISIIDSLLISFPDSFFSRLEIAESEVDVADSRLDIIESEIEIIDSRIDVLESEVDTLESRLDAIENFDSRIDLLESCCEANGSRIDLLESCCEFNNSRLEEFESNCDIEDSRLDLLESCCEVNDSRIDLLETCCDINGSRIDILFGLASRVDLLESCCEVTGSEISVLDSRTDLLESCCEYNGSRIDVIESQVDTLDSRIDLLESCCEVNDSRIDLLESCCEVTGSEIDNLDSRTDLLESCCEYNGSRIDVIESQVDTLDSRIDLLESCCEVNDSRIDLLESCCEVTGSEIDNLDSRTDLLESCCEYNGSRIDVIESQVDTLDSRIDLLESCCEVNDSRIDLLESCCEVTGSEIDNLDSRTDLLESCCEVNGSMVDDLDSRVDTLQSQADVADSRLDDLESLTDNPFKKLESCCDVNGSKIDDLDSRVDLLESCCEYNGSRIDVLESEIDTISVSLPDGLVSRIELLESCCEVTGSEINVLDSRTDLLESCCEYNGSRIDVLESEIDSIVVSLPDGLVSRIELLESCCEYNGSRIDVLESEIDTISVSLPDGLVSRIELLESCCEYNDSRIDVLQSEIDSIVVSLPDGLVSRIELLESCCEYNDSRIDVLESEIENITFSLPDNLDSQLEALESCCEVNGSRIDVLQSEIDSITVSLPDGLVSRIELLESCCEYNSSRIDVLESEIDTIVTSTKCGIQVCGDLNFTLDLLPAENKATVFEFCKCYDSKLNPPSVIFDPAIFGNGGMVELPKGSRLVFCGYGTVDLKDGVNFKFTGTACADMGVQPDWPEILLDQMACMVVDAGATAMITGGNDGAGCVNMRSGGCIVLDQPNSHLIFGQDCKNEIIVHADFGSHVTVDNPTALISFQLGVFDLIFENNSSMQISNGTIELNALNGVESPGVIRNWQFLNDSCLVLPGQCGKTLGLLRLAPNDPDHCCVTSGSENVMFNNLEGHVCGHGDLQYIDGDVNSITQIQDNQFCITAPMVEIFMNLSYLLEPGLIPPPDATILALEGTRPNQAECGRLVAFCPARDGSIVGLSQGDHDLFYDSSESCGPLDLVRGYDRLGRVFTISDCDASTRTPPAPPTFA